MFADGSYWTSVFDETNTPRTVWGGGAAAGMCACGIENNCAGADSSEAQRNRKCNCDAVDGIKRADAGAITNKAFLPIGAYHKAGSGSVNMTVGPIYCADRPIGE